MSEPVNSQAVWTYNPNGTAAQKWKVTKQADDSYEIRACTPAGRCLDVPGAKFVSGQPVQLYKKNDSKAQRWLIKPQTNTPISLVFNIHSAGDPAFVLDVKGGVVAPKTGLQLYKPNGTPAQGWVFIPTDKPDVFIIASQKSGLVLDAAGGE